jgi:hypothetical protein
MTLAWDAKNGLRRREGFLRGRRGGFGGRGIIFGAMPEVFRPTILKGSRTILLFLHRNTLVQ